MTAKPTAKDELTPPAGPDEADAVRRKLAELGITEADVADAVASAKLAETFEPPA